jgi:hypothetical protein
MTNLQYFELNNDRGLEMLTRFIIITKTESIYENEKIVQL